MRTKLLPVCVVLIQLLCDSTLRSADDKPVDSKADSLSELQGKWEMTLTIDGQSIRTIKTIKGSQETIQRFDARTNKLIGEHSSDLEASVDGDVKILTFQILGQPVAPKSYVYKVENDNLYEITGILNEKKYENNVKTLRIYRWKRVDQ